MNNKKINKKIEKYYDENGLKQIFIYATNRCNSKCKMCNIWDRTKSDIEDLDIKVIENIKDDPLLDDAEIMLIGGEFILHPKCDEILELLKGKNLILYTNGINTEKIKNVVTKFGISRVSISLDGDKDTYFKVRGVNRYDDVINTMNELKGCCDISLNATFGPFNTIEDVKFVKELAAKNDYSFAVQMVLDEGFISKFDEKISYDMEENIEELSKILKNSSFIKAHIPYNKGELRIPCLNIRQNIVIYSDGKIRLCHKKDDVILGNLNENNLSSVWNKKENIKLREDYMSCNDCWINCQRIHDAKIFDYLSKQNTKEDLVNIFGEFQWN